MLLAASLPHHRDMRRQPGFQEALLLGTGQRQDLGLLLWLSPSLSQPGLGTVCSVRKRNARGSSNQDSSERLYPSSFARHHHGPFATELRRGLGFRCPVHVALGIWLKQKWHIVSLISVIPLMWWEKRKLASSLEEMLMLFPNFYNDI